MATYYIKKSGNDANTGLSDAQAWTFTKLATFTPANGDTILFARGETFEGTLDLKKSAASGALVTYDAYGTGALPIITSLKTLTGWTNHSGNIWKVAAGIPANCGVVTLNGYSTEKGHWPAVGFAVWDTNVGITSITDSDLPATPNFTGADLVLYKSNWTIDRGTITNHSSHTLTYTSGSGNAMQTSGGKKYLIQNSIDCLTYHGAWYCDGSYFYMYFTGNPDEYTVKAGLTDYTVSCSSKNYNTIQNLEITGGNIAAIYCTSSSNFSIKNCTVKNTGLYGIYVILSSVTTIDNCNVSYTNGTGISIISAGSTIKNNTLDSCGQYAGMGLTSGNSHFGIYSKGTGNITEYNKVTNTGYIPIYWESSSAECRYNFVQNYPTLELNDGGGIYTFESTTPQLAKKCYGNIILDSTANGLYSDGLANNVEFYGNLVMNVSKWGIHMNEPLANSVHDNIFYNCTLAAIDISNQYFLSSPAAASNTIATNTIIQGNASQVIFSLQDAQANNVINFGTSDNNTIIVDPSASAVFYNLYVTPTFHTDYMTFAAYKTLTAKETNSAYLTKTLSTISVLYNDTKTAKAISLPGSRKDLAGTIHTSSITLQPFTAVVLESYASKYCKSAAGKFTKDSTGKLIIN